MPPDQFVVDPVAAEEARAMKIARRSLSMLHDILCIVAAEEDDQGLLGLDSPPARWKHTGVAEIALTTPRSDFSLVRPQCAHGASVARRARRSGAAARTNRQ